MENLNEVLKDLKFDDLAKEVTDGEKRAKRGQTFGEFLELCVLPLRHSNCNDYWHAMRAGGGDFDDILPLFKRLLELTRSSVDFLKKRTEKGGGHRYGYYRTAGDEAKTILGYKYNLDDRFDLWKDEEQRAELMAKAPLYTAETPVAAMATNLEELRPLFEELAAATGGPWLKHAPHPINGNIFENTLCSMAYYIQQARSTLIATWNDFERISLFFHSPDGGSGKTFIQTVLTSVLNGVKTYDEYKTSYKDFETTLTAETGNGFDTKRSTQFNAIWIDELKGDSDYNRANDTANELKKAIQRRKVVVNKKFLQARSMDSVFNCILCSNDTPDSIFIRKERRIQAIDFTPNGERKDWNEPQIFDIIYRIVHAVKRWPEADCRLMYKELFTIAANGRAEARAADLRVLLAKWYYYTTDGSFEQGGARNLRGKPLLKADFVAYLKNNGQIYNSIEIDEFLTREKLYLYPKNGDGKPRKANLSVKAVKVIACAESLAWQKASEQDGDDLDQINTYYLNAAQ